MRINIKNLPSDPNILRQIIISLMEENRSLQDQLALLKAKRFGKSSEKLNKQIAELELRIEENESLSNIVDDDRSEEDEDNVKVKPKRKALPNHLLREDIILNPDPKCPECGGEEFRVISEDISETLEYIPSSFKVMRHIRPRCACTSCEKIVQAYPASKAIAKGKAGPGLLAHIITQKYCNHLPLYRQSEIYEREGVDLSRTTMSGWSSQCSKLLEPLVDKIKDTIFLSSHIHGDDTPVKVLAPGLGKTKTGRIWSYVMDGRPHGDMTPPAVCYYYSPDRKGERPELHLKDFTGILHADAYAGYNKLYINEDNKDASIEEAACWAHTRRKFYEVTVANDKATIAIKALEVIGVIYKIEAKIRGSSPPERLECRQNESKELVLKLFIWLKKVYKELPKHSITAKAIAYSLNNEVALLRFLDDGKIEIDNNAAERSMRSIAIGRKNWLFAGSDRGGDTAATMYTLIETAKMNNINPHKYLEKVFSVIQDHNSQKIEELLPWNITLD